jgi:Helix-turn-helix domain
MTVKKRRSKSAALREHNAKTRAANEEKRIREARRANVEPEAFHMEAARHILGGLSIDTMHRLVDQGLLRPNRATRHLLFTRAELDRFLKENTV